jgi:hypothetical protein
MFNIEAGPIIHQHSQSYTPISQSTHANHQKNYSMDDLDLEDGPLFRATIQNMERKTSALKQQLKRLIKSIQQVLDNDKQLLDSEKAMMEAIEQMPCLNNASSYLSRASHIITSCR